MHITWREKKQISLIRKQIKVGDTLIMTDTKKWIWIRNSMQRTDKRWTTKVTVATQKL